MLRLQEVHIRKCYGSKIILKHNLHISSTLLYNKPSIPSSRRSRSKQKFTSKSKYDDSFFKNIFQENKDNKSKSIETQSQDTHQEVKTSGLEKIQNLVKSKVKSRSIFDSYANLRIDITKPNDELVRSIIKNTKTMNKKRFTDPATSWLSNFSQKQIQELQDFLNNDLPINGTINGKTMETPVKIGDLVTLGSESLRLYLVTSVPKTFNSRICTFLSDRGEIMFAPFSTIGYRFSGLIPDKYHKIIEKFVVLEQKYLNIPPIESGTEEKEEVVDVDGNGDPDESAYLDPNDFIVQQASSQLLSNTDVQTFIVPTTVRQIYVPSLLQISNEAFWKMGPMYRKLEELHRSLQVDDNNGEFNTPRIVSIFEILSKLKQPTSEQSTSTIKLGKSPTNSIDYDQRQYKISDVMAVLSLLKKQSHLWTILPCKSSFTPTKVTIWSLAQTKEEERTIEYLNNDDGLTEITKYCGQVALGQKPANTKPIFYNNVEKMLREYVNGKYKDDASISTTLVSLLRKVDKHFVELGIPLKEEAYKNEYSYGKAYDLLTKLNNDVVVNPLLWSEQANLPTEENASANTLTKQKFYNYMDQELANETPNEILQNTIANEIYNEDPLQHLRQDMRETLYIVLMIQRPMKLMMVFLYMKINKIIFYMPDTAFPLLPKLVSDIAGLGIPDKDTRTFVIQYRVDKKTVDEYISNKVNDKNYKVDQFNEVLNDEIKINQYKSMGQSNDLDFNNLIKLQYISSLLWEIRKSNHAYTNSGNTKLMVKKNNTKSASIKLVTENMIIANYLTARFATTNNIKILYRYLDPKFNDELLSEYQKLMKLSDTNNNTSIPTDQLTQMFPFFTRGLVTDKPQKHLLMGLSMYSNITSPLRRYIDLVNQWKIQDFFLDDKNIPGIASYLNGQGEIIRNIQSRANTFWQGLFLRNYQDLKNNYNYNHNHNPIDFKLKLITNPTMGPTVGVYIPNFRFINAHVEVSSEMLEDFKSGQLKIGGLIDSNKLHLKQVDFLENEVIFEYK
ncbi:RNB domain family protein [Candida albicans]|uniref:RNB domain family protein n=1 Tax=Candida albicans TaxID=5476 RepID=A0A8H6BTI7_CANAX|nr:RNB domain family protein [Candida albicans]